MTRNGDDMGHTGTGPHDSTNDQRDNILVDPMVISSGEKTNTVAAVVMEPTMILGLDPWDNLHQLWKDRYSDKIEWKRIESITVTERKLGIKR